MLMLSSSHAGEVANAAAAIDRHLRAEGRDWHWLVSRLDGASKGGETPTVVGLRQEVSRLQWQLREARRERDELREKMEEYRSWLRYADELLDVMSLNSVERAFVKDMRTRFELNPAYEATDKQVTWFVNLYRTHVKRKETA